jgi:hypothetical protein
MIIYFGSSVISDIAALSRLLIGQLHLWGILQQNSISHVILICLTVHILGSSFLKTIKFRSEKISIGNHSGDAIMPA